jgi:hypothetical protein
LEYTPDEATRTQKGKEQKMDTKTKKWEYLVIQIKGKIMNSKALSAYGAEGWELTQIVEAYATATGKDEKPIRYFIFKR